MSFAKRLREMRQSKGLSQAELAKAAGVPVATLRDLEQDRREPRLSTAEKLADALGTSLDSLRDPKKGKNRA